MGWTGVLCCVVVVVVLMGGVKVVVMVVSLLSLETGKLSIAYTLLHCTALLLFRTTSHHIPRGSRGAPSRAYGAPRSTNPV